MIDGGCESISARFPAETPHSDALCAYRRASSRVRARGLRDAAGTTLGIHSARCEVLLFFPRGDELREGIFNRQTQPTTPVLLEPLRELDSGAAVVRAAGLSATR